MKKLWTINGPGDLKGMKASELKSLAQEIREYLITITENKGGHLSSNLGIVELTIALLRSFNLPQDKVFYDCGHQSYVHKILTGRAVDFKDLREINGISGFQDMNESEYDVFSTGHTSNSISAAMGMAISRNHANMDYDIVPVIGDGSLTGGVALEALNNINSINGKVIIILNDNGMSISANKTAVSKFRNSRTYSVTKGMFKSTKKIPLIGKLTYKGAKKVRDIAKGATVGTNFFESLGLDYIGPVDGHNINALEKSLAKAKSSKSSVVVHVITEKGRGHKLAIDDPYGNYHGVSKKPDEPKLGMSVSLEKLSWSKAIASSLNLQMEKDKSIEVITPAMLNGSSLVELESKFPERVHDVGIAEQHALSFAAGMALQVVKPFVSIYSSFLQRGYDQLVHDIARLNLPVVIGVDRAGISAHDGATHHGLFDIPMLKSLPKFVVCHPENMVEAHILLNTCFNHGGPSAIRYERGVTDLDKNPTDTIVNIGSWVMKRNLKAPKGYFITYGNDVLRYEELFEQHKLNIEVINARFIKPIDTEMIEIIAGRRKPIYVLEKSYIKGGLGESIKLHLQEKGIKANVTCLGFPFEFIGHGSEVDLLEKYNLDYDSVINVIKNR